VHPAEYFKYDMFLCSMMPVKLTISGLIGLERGWMRFAETCLAEI